MKTPVMNLPPAGLIGLGNMGGAIAERLVDRGVELHVHDLDAAAAERLGARGARMHPSARSVADAAEIVCTCLPTVEASRAVVLGDDGLGRGRRIRWFVEMSTVGAAAVSAFAEHLAHRRVGTLDAPVSGGASGARGGSLTIMTAGPPEVREAVAPLLAFLASRVFVIGDAPGAAQTMKLVNNVLAAANIANAFEAVVLGVKLGLPPATIVEVIGASSGGNAAMVMKKLTTALARRFTGGGKIAVLDKDVSLALAEARQAGLPLSAMSGLVGAAKDWQAAVSEGMAQDDTSALIRFIEKAAGVEVRG